MIGPSFRALAFTPDEPPSPDGVERWLDAGLPSERIAVVLRVAGAAGLPLLRHPGFANLGHRCIELGVAVLVSVHVNELDDHGLRLVRDVGHGLHIKGDPPAQVVERARKVLGARAPVGASFHGEPREVGRGWSHATVSPIFDLRRDVTPPPGKSTRGRGVEVLAPWARHVPTFALGGVTPQRVVACARAGAHGIAGIRLFFGDDLRIGETIGAMRSSGWI